MRPISTPGPTAWRMGLLVLVALLALGVLSHAPAVGAPPPPPPKPRPKPKPKPKPMPPPSWALVAPATAAPGQAVLVRGNVFPAGRPLAVRLGSRLVAQGSTNAFGSFVVAFTVPPDAPAGRTTVTSFAGGRQVVADARIVAASGAPASTLAFSSGARLAAAPISGVPGARFRLAAGGLPPRKIARVTLAGRTLAVGATTPSGAFVRTLAVPELALGRRPLVLVVANHRLESYYDVQPPGSGRPPSGPVTLAAAGDIACSLAARRSFVTCRQNETANLLARLNPTVIAPVGDNQYFGGSLGDFASSFDATWGRLKGRIRPAIGNHEYRTGGAAGYFAYYGASAAPPGGYYSYDLGSWHVVVLNSNCGIVACAAGSDQERWLRNDLAAHSPQCTLAYFHHPRFGSGAVVPNFAVGPLWSALYDAGADVIVNGHYHDYERFAPQDPVGRRDDGRGIREFVVGTGGDDQQPFRVIKRNSEVRNTGTFGVLVLTLHSGSYQWRFVPAAGHPFGDSGSGRCH